MNKFPDKPILIVDDEKRFLQLAKISLAINNINNVITCSDSRNVENIIAEKELSLITLDINMPYISGKDIFDNIILNYPNIPIIMITGDNYLETAVEFMKKGAYDYITKPLNKERFNTSILKALEYRDLKDENFLLKDSILKNDLKHPYYFSSIITKNNKLKRIFNYCETIATLPYPILITGETGTGKELLAEAIHKVSNLKGEYVTINAAGLEDNVFSDTFFGHVKGAFTGADTERKGLIEKANMGTLFLDEIGDLSLDNQVKLLRFLQENTYYPLGSDKLKTSNARIIAATNKNLEEMVQNKTFRSDLFYRLYSHNVDIPPLRERVEDIPLLVTSFVKEANNDTKKNITDIPKTIYELLKEYSFPGNVRELKGIIFDTVIKSNSTLLDLLPIKEYILKNSNSKKLEQKSKNKQKTYDKQNFPTLKESELFLISQALKISNNNKSKAAKLLGITRQALNSRLKKFNK